MTRLAILLTAVMLSACADATGPRLMYEGRSSFSSTSPITVETIVTVRNTGSGEALVSTNTCGVPILAFENPRRTGTPAGQFNK